MFQLKKTVLRRNLHLVVRNKSLDPKFIRSSCPPPAPTNPICVDRQVVVAQPIRTQH